MIAGIQRKQDIGMTKSVEFFYDYSSPFSYFADCQLPAIAQRRGARIVYRPAILGVLIVESGNQPPPTVPAKLKYMTADMRRWAAKLNVPFVMNPAFPVRSITLMRAALIAQDTGVFARFHPAMWRAMWVDGANLGDPAVLTDVLNRADLDGAAIVKATQEETVKARLKANCDEALARGAFGLPTFFVGSEMFFGNDRVEFVDAALANA
jgi:2-hydroxychromene-2-carboxylate isomerase